MQPFRKYSRLKLAHLRQSRGCTKISVESVIMHRTDLENFFTDVFQTYVRTTVPLEVLDRKNFTAEFYHLKVVKPIFRVFFIFSTPQMGGMGQVTGLILVSLESPYPLS